MNGHWELCDLVVGCDVVENDLPRRIRRLAVFLHHLQGEE